MNNKDPKKVLGYFNKIARRYDLMNSVLSLGLHHLWKRGAVEAAGLKPGDRVLDACGGTGDLGRRAVRKVGAGGQVLIYDFSLEMLRAGKTGPDQIGRACGDAQCIAARSDTYDAVFIGFGLRNLSDMDRGLREIHRVLNPGGRLVCLEFSRPVWPFFRLIYDLYSFTVIPLAGSLVAGSRDAYTYLPESIRAFPLPDRLSAMLEQAGFKDVAYRRVTNGVAAIHVGSKAVD